MKTNFTLAPIFSDHMMFQAGKPIRIFGSCLGQREISIHFHEKVYVFSTSGNTFCFELPPLDFTEKPFSFRVSCGKDMVTVHDCLVGDLFIASGQSNMQFTLREGIEVDPIDNPNIRFYEVPKVPYDGADQEFSWLYPSNPHWSVCTKESAPWFSAIGYFVAQKLQQDLNIPIGVISCNLGDTSVFSWTDRFSLSQNPKLKSVLDSYDKEMAKYQTVEEYYALFHKQIPRLMEFWGEIDKGRKAGMCADDANNEALKKVPDPYIPMGPKHYNRPAGMFDSLLMTIVPFASKGVLFYQGESNHQDCTLYEEGFKAMIQGWRRVFKEPSLPFVFVQVAGYSYPGTAKDSIQIVREAQQNSIDISDNRYMVTAIDAGEAENIHPKDKTVVSKRLANVVLEKIYHQGQNSLSPAFFSYQVNGSTIAIYTRYNNRDLLSRSGQDLGFKITYDGETWENFSHVRLEHNTIILENTEKVREIRYAFDPFPLCDIYSENDLPLLPFRIKIER